MAYLANSTHFNNWIFSREEVALARRLGLVKAKRALRLEREQQQASGAAGSALRPVRKARSFAALLPKSSTASRDVNDWNDATDVDVEVEEQSEEKESLKLTPLLEFVTSEQEQLIREFYEEKILESCSQQFLRTSDKVKGCAMMLYKRFYLSNSVMEFHPKLMVPTAIYVAGKVEEQYISVDTVADQLHVDHKFIIGHEMILLEGVRFQLIMYHPFRALLGFMGDFQGFAKAVLSKELPASLLQKLHSKSCGILNELLLTDLPLTYLPAYLALSSLAQVADEIGASANDHPEANDVVVSKADVIEYIKRSKFSQGEAIDDVLERLETIEQVYKESQKRRAALAEDKSAAEQRDKQIKLIYKKLKKFHDEDKKGKKKKKDKSDEKDDKKKKRKAEKDDKKKAKKHKKDKN